MALERVSFARPVMPQPRLSKKYVPGHHSKRHWSDAEVKVLRDHYEEKGAQYCRGLLPGRTTGAIYQMALKLGLRGGDPIAHRRGRCVFTPELDAQIREKWLTLDAGKKGEVQRIADELNLPRWRVSKRAAALGLALPRMTKEPPWTKAELDLLKRVPLYSLDVAARMFREHGFNRGANAIKVKATRLSISRRYTATLPATQCANILGVDAKTFTQWILKGIIEGKKRTDTKRLPQQGGAPWSIERAYFRRWIIDNIERIDIRKVDKFAFVDLLTAEAAE